MGVPEDQEPQRPPEPELPEPELPEPRPPEPPSPDPEGGRVDAAAGERESAYELLQRGHDLLRRKHHAQAAVVLERAARLEPRRQSILEALGRAYYGSGQLDRAREAFEALLELDPSAHYAHFVLGQSLKRLGRTDEARTHMRLAAALHPTSAVYQAALRRLPPKPDAST